MSAPDDASGRYSGEHVITFSETKWHERVRKFLRFLPRELPAFAAITASAWGVVEVIVEVARSTVTFGDVAGPVLITAFVVTAYRAFSRYRAYVPDALTSEGKAAKAIYRKGQSGWQLALAKQMLADRIAEAEHTLKRVALGAEFIEPKRLPLTEYISWLKDRRPTLLRLVHAAAVQCTSELPRTLSTVKSESQLMELKIGVEALAKLYRLASDFEVECHRIEPPAALQDLHEMTHGWSTPVRDGITKLLAILEEIASTDRAALKAGNAVLPSFNIVFEPPENVAAFSNRLSTIDAATLIEAAMDD